MAAALKAEGVLYASFKYGTFEGERNGRYFTDFTEVSFTAYIGQSDDFKIEKMWITLDARPKRRDEKWLNVILRKQDIS